MLEELDLANMNIISVPEDMFLDNLFLTNIILKSNYLINLDSDILAYLTNLRKLDLSFNLFMGLGEHFFNEGLFFCPRKIYIGSSVFHLGRHCARLLLNA